MGFETFFRKVTRSREDFQKEEAERKAAAVQTEHNRLMGEAESAQVIISRADAFNREGGRKAAERLTSVKQQLKDFREKHNLLKPEESEF